MVINICIGVEKKVGRTEFRGSKIFLQCTESTLWFRSKMSPKGSCVEGLVPKAVGSELAVS
jgi:hypothetical protein